MEKIQKKIKHETLVPDIQPQQNTPKEQPKDILQFDEQDDKSDNDLKEFESLKFLE